MLSLVKGLCLCCTDCWYLLWDLDGYWCVCWCWVIIISILYPPWYCVFSRFGMFISWMHLSEFVCPNGPFSYSCSIARLVFFVFGGSYDALLSAFVPLFSVFLSFDGFTSSFFLFALYVYLWFCVVMVLSEFFYHYWLFCL